MRRLCRVTVNGERFAAYAGDTLVQAARLNGINIICSCREHGSSACSVRILEGDTFCEEMPEAAHAQACHARILSDLVVAFDGELPPRNWSATLESIEDVASTVLEVTLKPADPVAYLPGQYFWVKFAGHPARALSPTVRLDTAESEGSLRFHMRRLEGGRVSSQFGTAIKVGHGVKLSGPCGSACFRRGLPNRLVLVSEGEGFAPMWSIADAALTESAVRPLYLVVAVRSVNELYMAEALNLLSTCANVTAVIVTEEQQNITSVIRTGRAADHLPALDEDDIVYAAGPASLVDAVGSAAAEAGATFYGEPFLPARTWDVGWLRRLVSRKPPAKVVPAMLLSEPIPLRATAPPLVTTLPAGRIEPNIGAINAFFPGERI